MNAARFISFWTGFCSLSLEITWVRLFGYVNSSTPRAFAFVLMIYLLGIAAGAQVGKKICRSRNRSSIETASVLTLALAGVLAVSAPWLHMHARPLALDELVAPLVVFLTAGSLSVLFPITHHLGVPEGGAVSTQKGKHFSRVYMLNVLGASLGPLITGYVFMEHLTITQMFPVLGVLVSCIALSAFFMWRRSVQKWTLPVSAVGLCVTLAFTAYSVFHPNELVESFAIVGGKEVVASNENRHGIVVIAKEAHDPAFAETDYSVYGGNVYDGKVNVDLERNSNGLERPLAMHVLQPEAKRALVLGLSIGSWLTVLEGFPGIEEIDVVEINPGYLDLAKRYGPQSRALEDPRVRLHVDDARRWLRYQTDKRYDIILMNTTFHWRANSSMLLSQEMMALVNRHLADKGVITFNATGSVDAFYTASTVFKEVRRYQNFIYGANWDPFAAASNPDAWQVLEKVSVDGRPGFPQGSQKWREFAKVPFVRLERDLERLARKPELITDDNMLVEYRYGRPF